MYKVRKKNIKKIDKRGNKYIILDADPERVKLRPAITGGRKWKR